MTGREEIDAANKEYINRKLSTTYPILKRYISSISGTKTTGTQKTYLCNIIEFLNFINENNNLDLNDLNSYKNILPMDIDNYMEYIRYKKIKGIVKENKPESRATKLFSISNFFNFLRVNRIIEFNPCEDIEVPKSKNIKEIVSLTPEEVSTIKNNISSNNNRSHMSEARNRKWKNRDLAIFAIGTATGLRVSAIIEINMDDIDFKKKTIRVVEKGGVEKRMIIGKNTMDILKDWIFDRNVILQCNGKTSDALFISDRYTRMHTNTVRNILKRNMTGINKHITPHKMRSTCATNLYNQVGDIYLVQEQLGHKNITNTRRYAKVSEAKLEKAANILDELY